MDKTKVDFWLCRGHMLMFISRDAVAELGASPALKKKHIVLVTVCQRDVKVMFLAKFSATKLCLS